MNKKNKKAALSPEAKKVLDHLNRKGTANVSELAKMLDKSEVGIVDIISELRNAGFDIFHDRTSKIVKSVQTVKQSEDEKEPLSLTSGSSKNGRMYRFAVISDTRLGNRKQQLTLLTTAYKFFDKINVNFTLHAGNLVAGYPEKKYREENFRQTTEEQIEYAIEHYPKSKNFKTYIIAGQTDLEFSSSSIIRTICEEREDLIYRGNIAATFTIGQTFKVELIHPSTDNVPYAKTYSMQGILEQIIAEIDSFKEGDNMPDVVLAGGYHTPGIIPAYGEIDGFLLPSFITKTLKQKSKRITPTIGFWIIDVSFDEKTKQVTSIKPALYDWTHYAVKDDYLNDTDTKTFSTYTKDEKSVLEILADGPQSVGELSRRLNRNKESVKKIINKITDTKGLIIDIPTDTKQVTWNRSFKGHFFPLDEEVIKNMFVKKFKTGVVSDTHLCSNDQQITMLKKAYEISDEGKVDVNLHAGDLTDGAGAVGYRSHNKDVFIYGYTDQLDYVVKEYPKSKTGRKTKIIPGNHDWWDYESFGGNIVKELCDRRDDLEYGNYPKENFEFNGFTIQLFHPGGGGSYALSYVMQRHILNQRRNKEAKVDAIFFGNWHKALYLLYAGVHAFLCPSMKGQDEFHQKLSLPNARGMWLVEMWKDKDGRVTKIIPDYRDFTPMTKEKDY